jgi:hypothetical protein
MAGILREMPPQLRKRINSSEWGNATQKKRSDLRFSGERLLVEIFDTIISTILKITPTPARDKPET